MSDRLRSPSRRALLRAAGMLPFALAGASTLSAETTAEIEALPKPPTLTKEELEKLGGIIMRLWSMFEAGVTKATAIDHGVIQEAWKRSGPSLIANLPHWPDEPGKEHDPTLGCAYVCGRKARDLAGIGPVTPAILVEAWNRTKDEQMILLEKLKKRFKDGDVIKHVGLGCG